MLTMIIDRDALVRHAEDNDGTLCRMTYGNPTHYQRVCTSSASDLLNLMTTGYHSKSIDKSCGKCIAQLALLVGSGV